MTTEQPYFDKNRKQIKEFALIKFFHFKGVNEQGRGRKNYYMYKWVRLIEWKGTLYWTAFHLTDGSDSYFHLRTVASEGRIIQGAEIVQQY